MSTEISQTDRKADTILFSIDPNGYVTISISWSRLTPAEYAALLDQIRPLVSIPIEPPDFLSDKLPTKTT